MSGEDGIRTHVPLRTNGFQDRLVMTTSIPLHMFIHDNFFVIKVAAVFPATLTIIAKLFFYVNTFFE